MNNLAGRAIFLSNENHIWIPTVLDVLFKSSHSTSGGTAVVYRIMRQTYEASVFAAKQILIGLILIYFNIHRSCLQTSPLNHCVDQRGILLENEIIRIADRVNGTQYYCTDLRGCLRLSNEWNPDFETKEFLYSRRLVIQCRLFW